MRTIFLITFLFIYQTVNADCTNFVGKWINCTVDTPRLNIVQEKLLNAYIKPYQLNISHIEEGTLRFLGSYKKLFTRRKTIHDNLVELDKHLTIFWDDLPDGQKGPVLDTFSTCEKNQILESIEWVNLNRLNYSQDYIDKNDRFFKSTYFIKNGYLHRVIDSKKNHEDDFKYLGTLSCKKD